MKSYLKIENPGVAPSEAFTLLGASTKRGSVDSRTVGRFGTGNKQGINVCLRNGLSPIIFAGNLKMEFFTRPKIVDDGLRNSTFNLVCVKFAGKDTDGRNRSSTEDLGYVLEHGAEDWRSVDLALREFVSNAIDRAFAEGESEFFHRYCWNKSDDFIKEVQVSGTSAWNEAKAALNQYGKASKDYEKVSIEIVSENQVRAKSGTTRIFVPLDEGVFKFYNNLGKWFLHFSEPDLLNEVILPKRNRNTNESRKSAVIYRRGVRVREFMNSDTPSLFDYNLENLKLDESRQVDDWSVMYDAARSLADADEKSLVTLFDSFLSGSQYWEHTFTYGLNNNVMTSEQKQRWNNSFKKLMGEYGIACNKAHADVAIKKGYKTVVVPDSYVDLVVSADLPSHKNKFSELERNGIEVLDATEDALKVVDMIWDKFVSFNMTSNVSKPSVRCFRELLHGGATKLGFYSENVVYLNIDLCGKGDGFVLGLVTTAIEELAHHITKANDFTRDFQDFAFQFAGSLLMSGLNLKENNHG
jgi:hypothetical protein